MNVQALREKGIIEIYDEKGKFINGNFRNYNDVETYCEIKQFKIVDLFEVHLTEKI
jgi:hypothetical protein